jgi:hypothetical protein
MNIQCTTCLFLLSLSLISEKAKILSWRGCMQAKISRGLHWKSLGFVRAGRTQEKRSGHMVP